MTMDRRKVRAARLRRSAILAGSLLSLSACGPVEDALGFEFTVEEVASEALPVYRVDRIYRYRLTSPNADSLLRKLLNSRLAVDEAWEPTQDLCAGDPTGPRFTAILAEPDARMAEFNFEGGNGIRACTTRVKRYVVTRFMPQDRAGRLDPTKITAPVAR
jgi:hypothetical protein